MRPDVSNRARLIKIEVVSQVWNFAGSDRSSPSERYERIDNAGSVISRDGGRMSEYS
jgi:hypothetical protein